MKWPDFDEFHRYDRAEEAGWRNGAAAGAHDADTPPIDFKAALLAFLAMVGSVLFVLICMFGGPR